jgi:hypothetical protein
MSVLPHLATMNRVGQERNSLAAIFVRSIHRISLSKTAQQAAKFAHGKKPLLFLRIALYLFGARSADETS